MSYAPRALRRRPRRRTGWYFLAAALLLVLAAVAAPSFMYEEKAPPSRPHLIYRGEKQPYAVVVEGGEAYVPFRFVKSVMDPNAFYDQGVVVITTKDKVVKLATDSLTAYVNQHPVELRLPVILEGSEPYIPASCLEMLYPVSATLWPEDGTFIVHREDADSVAASVASTTPLRASPSALSRRTGVLEEGAEVEVFETRGGWMRVEGGGGLAGWLPQARVKDVSVKPAKVTPPKGYEPAPLGGGKVALVWEQVDSRTPDPSTIGPMDGLNVVSPTWFRLGEKPGEVENYADSRYVRWAHTNGYQVWALFSNSFDLTRTRAVLRDSALRDKVISQVLMYARLYSLDGINLDFENVYQDDGPYLTQFVRELTPLLHEMGLTVSIDVTVKSSSPTWSLCYERKRLAEAVDYVMLMAYDQYGGDSRVAGPNSSIPWTKASIETTLQEVPAEKLVLGIPFYMRLWKETRDGSQVKVTQRAIGMEQAREWLRAEGITPAYQPETGVMYAEKTVGKDTYRLWIEDETSLRARIDLARSYGLAGIAAWRRGFESESVWSVIGDYSR